MHKVELKVGLFIVITTLLIMASIGYVAYKKGVFSKVYIYTLSSKTGENLTEGMPVVFWGFNIGQVSSMELTEKGVLIQIKVPERNNRVIRANSKFVLDKPLLGTSRIIVTTDNLNDPPLSTKVFPELTVSNDINELIKRVQPIAEKLDKIAASVATLTANLADPQGDVSGILKNVQTMTHSLSDPKGDVTRILNNVETVTANFSKKDSLLEMAVGTKESVKSIQDILSNVRDMTVRMDGILQRVDTLAGKGDEEIYGREGVFSLVRSILRDLLAKLAKIDVTLDNLNKVTGEASDATKDLKLLRNNLDETVTAIGTLVDALDRVIPFQDKPEIKLP
jgi:phospholipid/cholesterol/gamma-HCH transport system substrate-binding protein